MIKNVGVHHRLALESLAKLIANDRATLLLRLQVKDDLARIELDLTTLAVLYCTPTVRDEGHGVAVDDGQTLNGHVVEVAFNDALQCQKDSYRIRRTTFVLVELALDLGHATIDVAILVACDRVVTRHDNLLYS